MKTIRPLTFMSVICCILFLQGCKKEQFVAPPEISFDDEDRIYVVKAGTPITITPEVKNAENASFEWKTDTRILSEDLTLTYTFDDPGQVYITFTVSTQKHSVSEEIRIDVAERMIPAISFSAPEGGYRLAQGSEISIIPVVTNGDDATYCWRIDGKEVSDMKTYTFTGEKIGKYEVSLTVTNEDGSAEKSVYVEVVDPSEIGFSWSFENEEYNMSSGRRIRLLPFSITNAGDATYTWNIDGTDVQTSESPLYVFEEKQEGTYKARITMTNQYCSVSKTLTVNVCPPEGTYRRNSGGNADWNKVYEFKAAPGQFVNENYSAKTMEEAIAYAESRLKAGQYVSLGGFGGYITIGFDHSIENSGEYDFQVLGNSFSGSSEPGIVWVMQDENGDGLPNDTWYELKGSEYGKPETISDYEVTYYRPSAPAMPLQWKDNLGNTGEIDYLSSFHRQDYYYPEWIEEDSYTLRGTRLEPRTKMVSANYWVNEEYEWGYADNFSPVDRLTDDDNYNAGTNANHFRISDAVTFDGQPADLAYIDFIKICTGVNVKAGWLGEVSTEVFGAKDYNLIKNK